jgi:hypothetical protein
VLAGGRHLSFGEINLNKQSLVTGHDLCMMTVEKQFFLFIKLKGRVCM